MAPGTTPKRERDLFSVKVPVKKENPNKKRRKIKGDEKESSPSKKAKTEDRLSTGDMLPLTYESMIPGQIILGCVQDVRDYEIVVSLPHKLMGVVSLARISKAYTALLTKVRENEEEVMDEVHTLHDLYKPGQYLVTRIVALEEVNGKTKVNLSLMPQEVNFGLSPSFLESGHVLVCAVNSVEDNGYIMDTGIQGVRAAFLKNKNTEGSGIVGVGSVVRCVINKIMDSSDQEATLRIKVTAHTKIVNQATLDISDTTNFALLQPGTAIDTTVSWVERAGLQVILADVDGVVNRLHLKEPFQRTSDYQLGASVRARVLYVTPLSKIVHLTLQQDVCVRSSDVDHLKKIKIGERIEDVEIYESSKMGVFVKLDAKHRGFCSSNHLRDSELPPSNIDKSFPVGGKRTCRVVKYNYLDQLFIVSFQKSVLEQQVLGYQGVRVGHVVKGTIQSFDSQGAKIAISKLVSGHVPMMHMTSTTKHRPVNVHSVGEVVRARVLKVNPEKRHIILTCKKQLVESTDRIVSKFSTDYVETITEGYIVKFLKSGMLIGFYNDVKAFAPKSTTNVGPSESLEKVFQIGQVVRCRVLRVEPERSNMVVSLDVEQLKPSKFAKPYDDVYMRNRVDCVVKEVQEDCIKVLIKPKDIEAVIPVHQLSDNLNHGRMIKELIQVGDDIHNAVVVKKNKVTRCITLSLLCSVFNWIESSSKEIKDSTELTQFQSYPSIVQEILRFGCMVNILVDSGIKGFVHAKNCGFSSYVNCTQLGMNVGQCLFTAFNEIDEKGRPNYSIALKDNMRNVTQSSVHLLLDYLREQNMLREALVKQNGKSSCLAQFEPGKKVDVTVTCVVPAGVHVKVDGSSDSGVILSDSLEKGANVKVGDKMEAGVLHVNYEEQCLELTGKPSTLNALTSPQNTKLEVGETVKCRVLVAHKKFIMGMLKDAHFGKILYLPSLRHPNDFNGRAAYYTVGRVYQVVVKYMEGDLVLGVLKEHYNEEETLSIIPERPSITFKSTGSQADVADETPITEEQAEQIINRLKGSSPFASEATENEDEGKQIKYKKWKTLSADDISQFFTREKVPREKKEKKPKKKKNKKGKKTEETSEEPIELDSLEKDSGGEMESSRDVNDRSVSEEESKNDKKTRRGNTDPKEDSGVDEKMDSGEDNDEPPSKVPLVLSIKKTNNKKNKQTKKPESEEESDSEDDVVPATKLPGCGTGFVWDVPVVLDEDKDSSSDDDDENDDDAAKKKKSKKLSKAERLSSAREEENRLHQLECARLQTDRTPQSAMDFEELLQNSPNSSQVWIQFISFHLESAEVEQAKAVARRALQIVNPQEEEERLNLWTVLLRLEVTYGTPEEVGKAYTEAQATNDQLKIQMAMAMVYAEAGKNEDAEKVYYVMSKKYSQELDVWVKAGIYFFSHKKVEEARRYMERALLSLPKKKHVELINRFGQLEFRFGDAERGRTMFESLLSNYPQRIDIWSVYVDLLTKHNDHEGARHILERMTGLKLRLRKMRVIFKKFLTFEKEHGTSHSVEAVKKRVEEFVASTINQDT